MTESFNTPPEVGRLKVKANIELVAGMVLAAAGFISLMKLIIDFFVYIEWYVNWGFPELVGKMLLFLALIVLGAVLIILGIRNNIFVKKYYEYAKFIETDPNRYISMLAVSVRESVQTTRKDIIKMIELGFFPQMQLDASGMKLICYGMNVNGAEIKSVQDELIEVKCGSCGAVSKVPKEYNGLCEYCGSPLLKNETEDA